MILVDNIFTPHLNKDLTEIWIYQSGRCKLISSQSFHSICIVSESVSHLLFYHYELMIRKIRYCLNWLTSFSHEGNWHVSDTNTISSHLVLIRHSGKWVDAYQEEKPSPEDWIDVSPFLPVSTYPIWCHSSFEVAMLLADAAISPGSRDWRMFDTLFYHNLDGLLNITF